MMKCGVDLGSRWVKLALMENGEITGLHRYDTITFYRKYGRREGDTLLVDFLQLGLGPFEAVVSTGYGRNTLSIQGGAVIPEIKAHVLGATFQTGRKNFTLLDLGGQDSKVARVDGGKLVDFITNDKCAAGSGRYLENMASVLGVSPDELGKYDQAPVELSGTCAIFGESELVGKIIEGHPLSKLCAGVNCTVFKRVLPMLKKFPLDTIVFTGGVAFNNALRRILERETGAELVVPQHPQYNGAIGCCVFAEAAGD